MFEDVSPFDYPSHLDELVTASHAAKTLGVSRQTVTQWVSRGIIAAVEADTNGCPLYVMWDILEAQLDSLDAA